MYTNTNKMALQAKKEKWAIPQLNTNNLEFTKIILETCEELKSPVIIGASEGAIKYMGGFNVVSQMVQALIKDLKTTIPVVLHLDHGTSVENCKKAIDAGFTSVMYDGSHLSLEDNLKNTKKVVEYAKKFKVSVEAEVGTVGGEEDGIIGGINYASLDECIAMSKTGITMLAASLGSVHGFYKGEPNLGFKEMAEYSKATNLPLVLHGGSGISDDLIKKAIEAGECKININTEMQEAFTNGMRQYIEENLDKKSIDPRNLMKTYSMPLVKKVIEHKIKLFGSNNKA